MAVDTRDRRMSMIGLASPVPRVLPDPDGTIESDDRTMLLFGYSAVAVVEPVTALSATLDVKTAYSGTLDAKTELTGTLDVILP